MVNIPAGTTELPLDGGDPMITSIWVHSERADGKVQKLAQAKYNRSTMENADQIQCKALKWRKKSRRRRNNGKQWKKQCAEQWEQSKIRARDPRPVVRPEEGQRRSARVAVGRELGGRICG